VARIDWNKARKFKSSEEKYKAGTELRDGRIVKRTFRDRFDMKAYYAEQRWLKSLADKKGPKKKKKNGKKGPQPNPTDKELERLEAIREQLGLN